MMMKKRLELEGLLPKATIEGTEIAIDKADSLASELCLVRPELRSRDVPCG
jgi:hypothetical protein